MFDFLTDEQISARLEAVFAPHRTVVVFARYGDRLGFRVYEAGSDRTLYERSGVLVRLCRSKVDLEAVIGSALDAIALRPAAS